MSSNAKEVGQAKKDNVMIYPSVLIMGKATEEGLDENRLTYTKHYYVGSERISAKTGTILDLGLYPAMLLSGEIPALTDHEFVRTPSDQSVSEHTNSFNSPFKYNGKEYDEETGNYYYGARYYDPKFSIFISVDPLAEQTFDS